MEKPMLVSEFTDNLLKKAKATNADEIIASFCKCKNLEGWCFSVTVKKHSVCIRKAKEPGRESI